MWKRMPGIIPISIVALLAVVSSICFAWYGRVEWVQAIGTMTLTGITALYAYYTYCMLDEIRRTNRERTLAKVADKREKIEQALNNVRRLLKDLPKKEALPVTQWPIDTMVDIYFSMMVPILDISLQGILDPLRETVRQFKENVEHYGTTMRKPKQDSDDSLTGTKADAARSQQATLLDQLQEQCHKAIKGLSEEVEDMNHV